jgi:hypothetical protein
VKKIWLILLLIALVFIVAYYYRFYQITQSNKLEADSYNQFTGQWEPALTNSDIPDRSSVIKTDNKDGLNNYSIIKGYFNQYDEASRTLEMRAAIAFTQNSLFEPADLKLSPNQSVYCVPEQYTDPNTGKSYSLKNLRIPVKDGATIFVPGEKMINFTDFVEQSGQLTFLLVQLTEDFDQSKTNYVQKIIVTGLCD